MMKFVESASFVEVAKLNLLWRQLNLNTVKLLHAYKFSVVPISLHFVVQQIVF